MSKGLIWQDDENIIDVVYQSIYGLPIKEAMQVIKKYQEKQLIPVEWIEKWSEKFYKVINGKKYYTGDGYDTVWDMMEDWEKENGK